MSKYFAALSFFLAAFFVLPVGAEEAAKPVPEYVVVKDKSFLKFTALQNSAPVTGEFKAFDAKIAFDPKQLDKSSLSVEVQTASVGGGSDEMVSSLKMPDWFSVEAFPKATFTSTKFHQMPETQDYYVDGQLTLRGQKKPLTLNFVLEHLDDHRAVVTGYATVARKDFGVGQGEWAKDDVIRNDVRITFRIVADRK